MRLTTFILMISLLQVTAATFGQTVTLKQNNAKLTTVLKEIRKQTGYGFLYTDEMLKSSKPVSLEVQNLDLEKALEIAFKDQSLSYSIENKIVTIKAKDPSFLSKVKEALGIPIVVSGRVTDSTGLALPGASIKVKEKVTKTDSEGRFSISAEAGTVVTVSFVGYQSFSFSVAEGLGFQNVVLKVAAGELQEVIVNTGYQKISKERVAGSFQKIDSASFNRLVSKDVLSRLDYLISGALNDSKTGLVIHGISSLDGARVGPLIVLDNFPYNGDLNNINPNDVESITVLKDAAANSIWGAKAGNGVIVITTKKGKYNQKFNLTFNTNLSITEKPDLLHNHQISPSQYIDVEKLLFEKGFYNDKISNNNTFPLVSPVVEILNNAKQGLLSNEDANSQINALRQNNIKNDYLTYLYRPAVNQQYHLSLSSGSEKANYLLSAGYDNGLNELIGNQSNRITINSSVSLKPVKNLEIGANVNLTQQNIESNSIGSAVRLGSTINGFNDLWPYAKLVNNGVPVSFTNFSHIYTDTAGHGNLLSWLYTPLDEQGKRDNTSKLKDVLVNLSANYKIFDPLSLSIQYQYKNQIVKGNNFSSTELYSTRELINLFTQISGNNIIYNVPVGGIMDVSNNELVSHNLRGQINFDKSWDNIHKFTFLAVGEFSQDHTTTDQSNIYGYSKDPLTYTYLTTVGDFLPLYGMRARGTIPGRLYLSDLTNRFVSILANGSYSYLNRYILYGSIRKDQSNLFGVNSNQKGVPLSSVGLAWDISKEKFWKSSLFQEIKLRTSIGSSGNVDQGLSALPTLQIISNDFNPIQISRLPLALINTLGDPNLRWEKVKTYNLGLDFILKNNILSGSVDVYKKKSTDLLSVVPADVTITGTTNLYRNSASLSGKGIDINVTSKNFDRTFKWNTNVGFSYNKSKVEKYYSEVTYPSAYAGGAGTLSPIVGMSPYNIISYKFGGLDPANGDPIGFVNGVKTKDYIAITQQGSWNDLVVSGSSIPLYSGAIVNTFSYKNLSLSTTMTYRFDYYFRKNTVNYADAGGGVLFHDDYNLRWQKSGDENFTTVPSFNYPFDPNRDSFYANSVANVLKGDHIRLQDLRISWDFNEIWSKKIGLRDVQIFAIGSNLGLLWTANKKGIDPDSQLMKTSKTFAFGCKIQL